MIKQLYPLLILSSLLSCKSKNDWVEPFKFGKPLIEIELKKNEKSNEIFFNNKIENIRLLELKTNPKDFFAASIDKVVCYKNNFYILDKHFSNLAVFDKDGNFIRKIGEIGLNSNQYRKIVDFSIDSIDNKLIVYSNENRALYYYSLDDGSFINKAYINLYGSDIQLVQKDSFFLYKNFSTNDNGRGKGNLYLINDKGKIIKKFFPFDSKISNIYWTNTGFLTQSYHKTIFSPPFNDTVYNYSFATMNWEPYLLIRITSDSIKANKDLHYKLFASKILIDSAASYLGPDYCQNNEYALFTYQSERRIKIGLFHFPDSRLFVFSNKNTEDIYTRLISKPLAITQDNNVVFSLSRDKILNLHKTNSSLFNIIRDANKNIIDSVSENSNQLILIGSIKK
ncbi:MAG: 6-bladed beta-propeller [Sediminibacterium magnilacihabitans]|jgi:hypothetical protein|nr:6-bladed beta-propeller [Sediminibacterium magnilacihabitans]PQV58020.1 6-bladed beta-propeller protein [Sediminibacterium magnilacihabitans]